MSRTEIDESMQKVKGWLLEECIFKVEIEDDQANYNYQVELIPNSGNLLYIIQPKISKDLILILGGVSLSEYYYQALMSLPKSSHDKLLWELRSALLFKDPDFCVIPDDANLKAIQFQNRIYFDGLTKDNLMKAVRDVHKCILFVIWNLKQEFGELSSTD